MATSIARVYANYFANWISKGGLINKNKISDIGIQPSFDRVMTKQYVRKIWIVTRFPINFKLNFTQVIRDTMKKKYPEVKVIVHTYNKPAPISTGSQQFQRSRNRAFARYDEYAELFSTLNENEAINGKTVKNANMKITISPRELESRRDKYDSYKYVTSQVADGKKFMLTSFAVELLVPDTKDKNAKKLMTEVSKFFRETVSNMYMGVKEIKGNISVYLKNYGLVGYKGFYGNPKGFPSILMSPENLAVQSPWKARGVIGDNGIILGSNFKENTPLQLDFWKSSGGQTILVLAKTGCGKSYIMFQLLISAICYGIHAGIIDIKGGEYDDVVKLLKGIKINMDSSSPNFVNTLRLDDVLELINMNGSISSIATEAEYHYTTAVEITVNLLMIMSEVPTTHPNYPDLRSNMFKSVIKVYSLRNVDKTNPKTFEYTSDIKYTEVIDVLNSIALSKSITEDERSICSLAANRCMTFLDPNGIYGKMFTSELTVKDIFDAPIVSYSFNKNEKELSVLDAIRVLMVQTLERNKQYKRKLRGEQTIHIDEEFQRFNRIPGLVSASSSTVTGARSLNVMSIIVGNSRSMLDHPDAEPIKSNFSTYILGALNADDREDVMKTFDLRHLEKDLIRIDKDTAYTNSFVIDYTIGNDKGNSVFKVVFDKKFTELFRTKDLLVK